MNIVAPVRKALAVAGIVLLGGALAYAPIAAFDGDMTAVSKAGIAGAALVVLAWLLPRPPASETGEADAGTTFGSETPDDRG